MRSGTRPKRVATKSIVTTFGSVKLLVPIAKAAATLRWPVSNPKTHFCGDHFHRENSPQERKVRRK